MKPPTVRDKISICWGASPTTIHMLWMAPGDGRKTAREERRCHLRILTSRCPHRSRSSPDNPWTPLWTTGDNVTAAAYCGRAPGSVHRSYTARTHRQSRADLGGRGFSPDSTPPMTTTTYLLINQRTN